MTQAEIKSLKKGDFIRQTASFGSNLIFEIVTKHKTRIKVRRVYPTKRNIVGFYPLSSLKFNIWSIDKEWAIRQQVKEWLESI